MNESNDIKQSNVQDTTDIHNVKLYQQQIRSQDFYTARKSDVYNSTGIYGPSEPGGDSRQLIIKADAINDLTQLIYDCQDLLFERGRDWFLYDEELNSNSLENDYSLN